MAISISGSNSISGLSGMDTDFDEVLAKLKEVESTQLNRLEAWKDDWNLRYEAFGEIISQVQTAQSVLADLANKNNFVSKNVTSSNENVVTAVASAAAQDVQHNITVSQMASNAIWANMHVYDSKTDIINDTGTTQEFSYTYAGTTRTLEIAPKTTLESFVNLITTDAENPGVQVRLGPTGAGYVFQMAGESTGEDNDLIVSDSSLVGMTSAGATSTWQTNSLLSLDASVTDPNQYAYDLLMEDGNWFTVTISGDKTNTDLVNQINAQTGRSVASLDENGALQLADVKAVYRRNTEEQSSRTPGSTTLGVGSNLNATLGTDTTVTFTLNDGAVSSTHEVALTADMTMKEALFQIAQAAGSSSAELPLTSNGGWEMNLANVSDLAFSSAAALPIRRRPPSWAHAWTMPTPSRPTPR
jgi:flagellar hook-associated protein 2